MNRELRPIQVEPRMPALTAASVALEERLLAVHELLAKLRKNGAESHRTVHQIRVAARRAAAALGVFQPCIKPKQWKKARTALRRIRRAAGAARRCDVHRRLLRELIETSPPQHRNILTKALNDLRRERNEAGVDLLRQARKLSPQRFRLLQRSLLKSMRQPDDASWADVAIDFLKKAGTQLAEDSRCDLSDLRNLHEFRLSAKKLRYALELTEPCLSEQSAPLRQRLEQLQDHLGEINDTADFALRLETIAHTHEQHDANPPTHLESDTSSNPTLGSVIEDIWRTQRHLHETFLTEWQTGGWADLFTQLRTITAPPDQQPLSLESNDETESSPTPDVSSASTVDPSQTVFAGDAVSQKPRRIAAIDVGTNSMRLVIAEVTHDGAMRIIDDEKALTRLGRGMVETGRLSDDAMSQSLHALDQFKKIAEGHGVERLRAVATSAVREAANGRDFVAAAQEKSGVALEVISAQTEARLAFRSVTQAFDLHGSRTAVVDIGGGSTEIVLGSGELIEQIYAIPLGAIGLTEQFRIQDEIPSRRYRQMRELIKRTLKTVVHRPPFVPHLLIGTGGTFTSLGTISMQRGTSHEESDFLPFSVRGYELQRSDLKHVLDHLRRLPLHARLRVPGISPERADIIVAGLTIIDCVLKHLQVNTIRVHDQGIRTGLLRTMADEIATTHRRTPKNEPDRMRSVRQFASACNFEQSHADHVAHLALQLFDQLAADETAARPQKANRTLESSWASAENRELLHAAALLHDVGYFINYAKHHKHTYHLVMHSDLAWFTHRQREIIANIARYHRGAMPKKSHANFASLNRDDRATVRRLAAILRLAVGLDRSHTHNVQSVTLTRHEGMALVEVFAGRDASIDVWGAVRKSQMFEDAFGVRLRFIARAATGSILAPTNVETPSSASDSTSREPQSPNQSEASPTAATM